MEKLITEEITRVLEIMGISKEINIEETFWVDKGLIAESSLLKSLMRQATDFLKPEKISTNSGAKEFMLGGRRVERDFFEAFERLSTNFETHWPTFLNRPGFLEKLASILRGSDEITKQFYDDLMTDLILNTTNVKSEKNFYNSLRNKEIAEGNAFDFDKEIELLIPDPFERELLSNTFKKNYNDVKKGTFKPTVFPKKTDVKLKPLTEKQIIKLNKVITTSTRFWNTFLQLWKKTVQDFREEVQDLSVRFLEQLPLAKTPEDAKALANAYAVQISKKLSLMEIKLKGSALDLMNEEGIPTEVLDILRDNDEQFFRLFRDGIKQAEEKGFDLVKSNIQFMVETLENNGREMISFLKNLFSKNFFDAVKHLFDPRRDLGIWFYTNQWAGLNKLFHLAVKTGALQNKKGALEWLFKALVATNAGYLAGWLVKSGAMSFYELLGKPIINNTIGHVLFSACSLKNKFFGVKSDCSKVYLEKDYAADVPIESVLLQEFWTNSVDVINEQYEKRPVYSSIMRVLPVANYLDTWRNSIAAQGIETISERSFLQNAESIWGVSKPEQTVQEIKNDIKAASPDSTKVVDSIDIKWQR